MMSCATGQKVNFVANMEKNARLADQRSENSREEKRKLKMRLRYNKCLLFQRFTEKQVEGDGVKDRASLHTQFFFFGLFSVHELCTEFLHASQSECTPNIRRLVEKYAI